MHRVTPALRTIAAGLVLLTGVAACGSTSPGSASSGDPLASLTAKQIAQKARTNMLALSNYRIVGAVTESGKSMSVDITAVRGKGCQGTIDQSGVGNVEIISVGSKSWIKADAGFWRSSAQLPPSTVTKLAGKYLALPSSQLGGLSSGLCSASGSGGIFTATNNDSKLTKGPVVTMNGQQVLTLIDGDKSRGYVTDTANPLFVRIAGFKASQGYANVTSSSAVPTITAPPANEVISISALG